jgi:hypothetical protein
MAGQCNDALKPSCFFSFVDIRWNSKKDRGPATWTANGWSYFPVWFMCSDKVPAEFAAETLLLE